MILVKYQILKACLCHHLLLSHINSKQILLFKIQYQNHVFFFVYQVCLFIKIVNEHLRLVNLIKLKDLTIFKKWYHCETLVIVSTLGPSGSGEWRMLVIFVEQWPNFKNKMPKKMLYFSVPNSGCRSCCIVYKNDFFWVETWRYFHWDKRLKLSFYQVLSVVGVTSLIDDQVLN